ncbi:MAG: hypothetical protein AB1767_06140 [Bacillota bacterium]
MCRLINGINLKLDAASVLLGQGIDPAKASPRLKEAAGAVLAEAEELAEPAALLVSRPVVQFAHQRLDFAGGFFEGSLVARALAGASQLSLVLCTVGSALEERVAALMAADPARALALDGAATAAVRATAATVSDMITAQAKEQTLQTGMRIYPGQEGWPIEQQSTLFELIPAARINVRLTESYLMLPRKSVSFVIGLGSEMLSDKVPCDYCSKKERCQWGKVSSAACRPSS